MAYFTPGNGHENGGAWPKGRRRNPKTSMAGSFVDKLRNIGLSWRDISKATGVSVRSLRKYSAGRMFPSESRYARIVNAVARFC